jgi:hypothetical protein
VGDVRGLLVNGVDVNGVDVNGVDVNGVDVNGVDARDDPIDPAEVCDVNLSSVREAILLVLLPLYIWYFCVVLFYCLH